MKLLIVIIFVSCLFGFSTARFVSYNRQVDKSIDVKACVDAATNGIAAVGQTIKGFSGWVANVKKTVENLKIEKSKCDVNSFVASPDGLKFSICNLKFVGTVLMRTGGLVADLLALADGAREIAVQFGNGMLRCFGQEQESKCYYMANNYYQYFLMDHPLQPLDYK